MRTINLKDQDVEIFAPITEEWAETISRLANDKYVRDNIGSHSFPFPYRTEDAMGFITKNRMDGSKPFAVDFRIMVNSSMAGVIGLSEIDYTDRKAHIGYWIAKEFRGRGIATRATKLVMGYAQQELGIRRLFTKVLATNPASARVLLKCGFMLEGVLREDYLQDGRFLDFMIFGYLFRP